MLTIIFLILFIITLSIFLFYPILYQEKYFPNDEVKLVKRSNPGIPQCKYQGLTPILTCSYDIT